MDFRQVDLKNLIVPPLTRKDQRTTCSPLYKDPVTGQTAPLEIQTPVMRIPFGFSSSISKDSGKISYSISGAFDDRSQDTVAGQFYHFCVNFENYSIALAHHNSEEWFGEKHDLGTCRALMNKWVKKSKDPEKAKKYSPTFKTTVREKVPRDPITKQPIQSDVKEFWSRAFELIGQPSETNKPKPLDITKIGADDKGSLKMKLTSYYVINGKPGFTWDLVGITVTERKSSDEGGFNPNMYGDLPVPAIPASTDADNGTPAVNYEDDKNAEGKRVATDSAPTTDEPAPSGKRSRKN